MYFDQYLIFWKGRPYFWSEKMVDFSGRVSSPSTPPVIVPFAAMDEEELFERNSLAQSMSINLDFSDEETDDEHPLLRAYKGLNFKI